MASEQWGSPTNPLHPAIAITSSLANNTRKLGGQIIPSGYMSSAWQLKIPTGLSSPPTTPFSLDLYAITTLDNTDYAVGDSGVAPQGQQYLCSFTLYPLASSGQILHQVDVPLPPFRFIPVLHNKTGVAIDDTGTVLGVSFYNRQIV
jgi:hypothetical protein